ncbi:unnamed protein product [Dicrocoelium dendriticum]|nr:unnamed protein product [Dicrocoelium dendriticum]
MMTFSLLFRLFNHPLLAIRYGNNSFCSFQFTLTVNTGGCRNCAAAIFHILNRFAALTPISIDRNEEAVRIPSYAVSRAAALLRHSGWEVSFTNPSEAEAITCDRVDYEFEDDLFLTSKLENLEPQSKKSRDSSDIPLSQACPNSNEISLIAVLSLEVECRHTHWVPAWSILVPRGPLLDQLYRQLSVERPCPPYLRHLKRIDSCRVLDTNHLVPVFLDLAVPRSRLTPHRSSFSASGPQMPDTWYKSYGAP